MILVNLLIRIKFEILINKLLMLFLLQKYANECIMFTIYIFFNPIDAYIIYSLARHIVF